MGRVPSPPSGSEDEDDLDQSPPAKLSRYIGWARNSIFIVLCPLVWGVICYPITSSTRSDTNASLSHQIMLLLLLSFTKPHPTLCDPCTTAHQASLSSTVSQSFPKFMSIESLMPSSHLILSRPLLLLPSLFPRIGIFSSELALCIKGPKYWSFSFITRSWPTELVTCCISRGFAVLGIQLFITDVDTIFNYEKPNSFPKVQSLVWELKSHKWHNGAKK